jgi:chemotaxis protein methyltransferase CheR
MVLAEYARAAHPRSWRFEILATDISPVVIETARAAVYPEAAVAPVPEGLRGRYLRRSRDREFARVRIAPAVRERVRFRELNLLDADYGFPQPFDVAFCRNVMIYFNRPAQEKVLERICRSLRPGGYLLMGHAESLNGMRLPLTQAATTVYRRSDG